MIIKAALVLTVCILSITRILPAIGATNYALLGICHGLIATFIVAYDGQSDQPCLGVKARYSLIVGVLIGLFWPAAPIILVARFIDGGGRVRGA